MKIIIPRVLGNQQLELYLPFEASASACFGQQSFQLWPEAGVEPSVHDRVGEGGGQGYGVAQPQHEVEGLGVLKKMR